MEVFPMTSTHMTKQDWIALFRDAGVDDATMHRWHVAFEARWPAAHQAFLEWLRLPSTEIDHIRKGSRQGASAP
jgi:hypothetical protein